jgi:hypothetical protein
VRPPPKFSSHSFDGPATILHFNKKIVLELVVSSPRPLRLAYPIPLHRALHLRTLTTATTLRDRIFPIHVLIHSTVRNTRGGTVVEGIGDHNGRFDDLDITPRWSRRAITWILLWIATMWHIRAKDAETYVFQIKVKSIVGNTDKEL